MTRLYIFTCIYFSINIYTHTHTHTHICTLTHSYIYIYIYTPREYKIHLNIYVLTPTHEYCVTFVWFLSGVYHMKFEEPFLFYLLIPGGVEFDSDLWICISAMLNANSVVLVFNSHRCLHILWIHPLHHDWLYVRGVCVYIYIYIYLIDNVNSYNFLWYSNSFFFPYILLSGRPFHTTITAVDYSTVIIFLILLITSKEWLINYLRYQ